MVPDTTPAPVPDSTPPVPPEPVRAALPVRFALVGDINLGTTTLPDGIPPDSGRAFLHAASPELIGDLVIGNFEGTLADSGTPEKCDPPPSRTRRRSNRPRRANCYAFVTPTWLAPRLVEAGLTHLNLANNHANDMGPAGRLATDSILRHLGLTTYGPAGRVSLDTLRAGDSLTIVGVIGFATYPFAPDLLDIPASVRLVDSVASLVDVVVVTFHGGAEGASAMHVPYGPEFLGREPRGSLREWTHAVVDAGADLVVGHGPHVLRGMEFYRGRLIAYSLGNFATYRGFNLTGALGLTGVLQVSVTGTGEWLGGRLVPMVQLPRTGPAADPAARAAELLSRLSVQDFGAAGARFGPDGAILSPPPPQVIPAGD